ncbi:hypothetical protein [Leptolyngbya sp. FACHB-711]|uniref:hypothetical protein n=1 Tax=unclassified Leptolyngbya TaxID=2650499 RepID=UPI001689CFC4|nr:hypothetical protein [Leptolyngbya sp. FACHB-711]MBD1853128.1 hypothetical protein [Cyanobacteria bacterium FACHB-502]MBD2028008.1 hypothetical protein [Leptolyngbya sp. FACHB-711]
MASHDEYKRQIMQDLAKGNSEKLDDVSSGKEYENFDDFARRSTREERRAIFGRSFHPDRIPTNQMEPELQKAVAQIHSHERDDVAREFFHQFKKRGLSDHDLEKQLGLSTHTPGRMTADDVSKLASFAYHYHPDIFQEVLADQPAILKFISNPMVGAALGAVAAKWLGNRH